MPELGIDRYVSGVRAVRVGVLLVEEGAFGFDAMLGKLREGN